MDHTVKTRDILTYHYIEIRYFYYKYFVRTGKTL